MAALPAEILCQVCEDEHPATHECKDCKQAMCEELATPHHKVRKGHKATPLYASSSQSSPLLSPTKCVIHSKTDLEYFCKQDQQPICVLCLHAGHENHPLIKLTEAYREREKSFSTLLKQSETLVAELKQTAGTCKDMKNTIDKKQDELSRQITLWYEQIKASLELHYKRLLNEVKTVATKKKQILDAYVEETASFAQKVSNISTKLRSHQKAGIVDAALLEEYQLRQTMKSLSTQQPLVANEELSFINDSKFLLQTLEQTKIVEGGVSPYHCSVEGDGVQQVTIQTEAKFIITLRDNKNQVYKPKSYEIPVIRFEGLDKPISPTITDNENGTVTVAYRLPEMEDVKDVKEVKLNILVRHQPIKGSPFHVKIMLLPSLATSLLPEYVAQLSRWLSNPLTNTTLLYKASRDGRGNAQFHQRCDKKGPTITIVYTNNGYIFGGYAAQSWDATIMDYKNADGSFLFSLTDGKGRAPIQCLLCRNVQYALRHDPTLGPTWGGNDDLAIQLNDYGSSYSYVGYCYQVPGGFNGETILAGQRSGWGITDVEVFLIER